MPNSSSSSLSNSKLADFQTVYVALFAIMIITLMGGIVASITPSLASWYCREDYLPISLFTCFLASFSNKSLTPNLLACTCAHLHFLKLLHNRSCRLPDVHTHIRVHSLFFCAPLRSKLRLIMTRIKPTILRRHLPYLIRLLSYSSA